MELLDPVEVALYSQSFGDEPPTDDSGELHARIAEWASGLAKRVLQCPWCGALLVEQERVQTAE